MGIESKPRGRILVVDDEKSVGRLLQQWLTGKGYQVRHVDGFDGVRQALTEQAFDLVTLDIMMPGVDGLEVLRWLRAHYPDVGVVMATALDRLDTVLEAMRAGAINYLLKPFNLDLVGEEIGRAMEHQRLKAENRAYQQELERRVEERTGQLQEAYARLERQVRELEGRDRLVHFQMEAHTLDEAYQEGLEVLRQVVGTQRAVFHVANTDGGRLEAVAVMGLSGPGENGSGPPRDPLLETGESSLAARAFTRKRLEKESEDDAVAVPILYQGEVRGVFCVELPTGAAEQEDVLNALWRLAGEMALVLQGAAMAEELEKGTLSLDEWADLA